jgi:hypothetical protein
VVQVAETVRTDQSLNTAIAQKTEEAVEYLPSSDAKKGAFRNLTAHGESIPKTIAAGAEKSEDVLHEPAAIMPYTAPVQPAPVTTSTNTIHYHIERVVVENPVGEFVDLLRSLENITIQGATV